MCLDNYGQYILPGRRFQPISKDHCTQCICQHGKPTQCLTIKCQPPDNCKKSAILQKKGSCCEFICLNPDEEDDAMVEKSNKLSSSSMNKLTPLNKEYSESANTIDRSNQLNDLEMNGNVQSSVQGSGPSNSDVPNGLLKNDLLKTNAVQDNLSNKNEHSEPNNDSRTNSPNSAKSNSTTTGDKRYSSLENTLKKLMSNKNPFKLHEEVTKNGTFNEDRRQINPTFPNLGIGVGVGK